VGLVSATKENYNTSYGTKCETDFIDRIGCFSSLGGELTRTALLRRYRNGIEKRNVWGGINREAVFAYLTKAEAFASRSP
jgi:hypothetical protein